MLLLLLVVLIAAAAFEVANGPRGRHRGARRLTPAEAEHHDTARHRR